MERLCPNWVPLSNQRDYGPSQQSLLGATRPFNNLTANQPDWNWFEIAGLNYVHDFGNQSGDVFEVNLLGYDAQQFHDSSVDTGFLDIRVGPRFGIFQDNLNGASVKPYVAAAGATLADAPYLGSVGGGVTMHFNWAEVGLNPYVEFRRLGYLNSDLYPLASGLDGTLATFALQADRKSLRAFAGKQNPPSITVTLPAPGIAMIGMAWIFGSHAWLPRCGEDPVGR